MGVRDTRQRGGFGRVTTVGVVVLVAVLVATAAGYVVWDRNWRRASPRNPGRDCPVVVPARGKPILAAPGVHRVMLIGDSIMVQASCAVAESLAPLGIETSRHAVSGSGLITGMDWVTAVRPLLAAEHPDIVMAIFVGNYGPPVRDAAGRPIVAGSPAFLAAWQRRAVALSKQVHAAGAEMYWVSPPPFALPPFRFAHKLFDGYASISGDHTVDAGGSLADTQGHEVGSKKTCGKVAVIRTADVAHLTDDGARIYGQTIAHDLSAGLGVRTAPKPC